RTARAPAHPEPESAGVGPVGGRPAADNGVKTIPGGIEAAEEGSQTPHLTQQRTVDRQRESGEPRTDRPAGPLRSDETDLLERTAQ
ncbi:MAG TPA: hypothetical protein VLX59_08435, partial [Acidimicrobiales bacterium]|nr:hypothetical protein [Acidimicrobiales bacterium]